MSNGSASTGRTLEERLDAFAKAWRPEKGDKLIGVVTDVDLRTSDYGPPYPIITVEQEDGSQLAFHGFHAVARRELAKQRPQPGDRIGIAYHGKGEPAKPGMSGAELYRIIVERDEQRMALDWDAIGVTAEAEAIVESADAATPADDDIPF